MPKIIPAIDIMNHQVVQLVGGVPGTEKIQLPDPTEVAQSWIDKGAKYLHIVDLDAAFGEDDNLDVIKYIAKNSKVPVQVGVDRVIIGTRGVTDREWFREMAMTFPDKLILALDTKGGNITVKGWQEASSMTLSWMLTAVQAPMV